MRAIISYAHESDAHARRVRELADRLRHRGIACELDQYLDVPAAGWPTWMSSKIADSDSFVLVVPSEAYLRRWTLTEKEGVGLGARWESKLIKQVLYEAEGFNKRVIPVLLDTADAKHIPIELRDTTRYDMSARGDEVRLLARLTNQLLVQPPDIGVQRRIVPEQTPIVAAMFFVLRNAKASLPADVIAAAIGDSTSAVNAIAAQFVKDDIIHKKDGKLSSRYDLDVLPLPPSSDDLLSNLLNALLGHIKHHGPNSAGQDEIENILHIAAVPGVRRESVAPVFQVLDKPLKRRGDKRLVWRAAQLSLDAARVKGRGEDEARAEAVALICGTSWVLQRIGRLDEAKTDAQESLVLGEALHWPRNTAFCKKCLGRLSRIQAEEAVNDRERDQFLTESEASLREAMRLFADLREHDTEEEIGECHSLLGRTLLLAKRLDEMDAEIGEADRLLHNEKSKAYLDFMILRGDVAAARGQRAVANGFYSDVIARRDEGDAQISEIHARAYFARGINGKGLDAQKDLQAAASIWHNLQDPSEYKAVWHVRAANGTLPRNKDVLALLQREGYPVRARALQLHDEASRPSKSTRARRVNAEPGVPHWEHLVQEARRLVAIERDNWAS